jgi:protein tyrosine/serine phosphatase
MQAPPQSPPDGAPARRPGSLLPVGGFLLLAAAIVLGYLHWGTSSLPRNFLVVEPGRLYRSAQPDAAQFAYVIKQYGIRTVINLRNPAKDRQYVADGPLVRPYGVRVVRLPISSTVPLDKEQLATLRKVYNDPRNYPILVHCKDGHARSGVAAAIWRIEMQGWQPAAAVRDMIQDGYPVHPQNARMRQILLHWKRPAPEALAAPDAR